MNRIFLIFILFFSICTFSQVDSDAFKNAAKTATKLFNENKQCVPYVVCLNKFLDLNSTKYKIKSYKSYKYSTIQINAYINHNGFDLGNTPISDNGLHYIVEIDGYVFDNNNPQGILKSTWESKLECIKGIFPKGFNDRSQVLKPLTLK